MTNGEKKKVFIILFTLSIGGAERHASSIANFLSNRGYDVEIILLSDKVVSYALEKEIKVVSIAEENIAENGVRNSFFEKVKLKLLRVVSKDKYDRYNKRIFIHNNFLDKVDRYFDKQKDMENSVVLSFMTIPNLCACYGKKKYHYKTIIAEFTAPQFEFEPTAEENYLKKELYPFADKFIFQTYEQKAFYKYLNDMDMKVIPNPIEKIDVAPCSGIRRKEIVNYCKHVKAKNLPLLIDAFSILANEYPEYQLVIYGDGPERINTEICISEHHLEDKVILKPYAQNVLELVRDSAMFVSSSDREGISNSMLEAMAIGLPTICTDCPAGGARMMIKSYDNGILVPVKDVDALYNAMKYVIDHPIEAERMGEKATEIRELLEKEKILSQWVNYLEK